MSPIQRDITDKTAGKLAVSRDRDEITLEHHQEERERVQELYRTLFLELADFLAKQSSLTLFKQSDLGPDAIGDPLPFATELGDLYKIGSYFSMAVAQGEHYNTGFFGPLPVLDTAFLSLIFAAKINDETLFDDRFNGWNYITTCFFYHRALNPVINRNRVQLEELFGTFFYEGVNLSSITSSGVRKLRKILVSCLTESLEKEFFVKNADFSVLTSPKIEILREKLVDSLTESTDDKITSVHDNSEANGDA
ncbi:MAG: hypothetical protein ACFFD4_11150 [Candidatus Odinarchaeota archaeon]